MIKCIAIILNIMALILWVIFTYKLLKKHINNEIKHEIEYITMLLAPVLMKYKYLKLHILEISYKKKYIKLGIYSSDELLIDNLIGDSPIEMINCIMNTYYDVLYSKKIKSYNIEIIIINK